jgi:hypothetical protein
MRDPARIRDICVELMRLWSGWPDLRLGQIVSNAANAYSSGKHADPFYIEDEELMKYIRVMLSSGLGSEMIP